MAAAANFLSKFSLSNPVLQSDCRRRLDPYPPSSAPNLTPESLKNLWLSTQNLWLRSSTLKTHALGQRRVSTIISFSLPTAKPERVSSIEKAPKWSSKAIKSFAMGELEARKLKYPNTGTESILMGILIEGTSLAAKFLRANEITLSKVRDETVRLLGKADMFFFSPEHPPLTEEAQRALDWAVDQKIKSGGSGEITTSHLLLGIWSEVESPGHKILHTLGFNSEKVKELESLISEPGFVDDL
ncbi:ATP-dependent Clp protease ATP-binding subunit CLPT2, chloroplastic [Quillaja saponaria]|uniref:ATP-dependent Clp protease ATP-binding subunit CLPT2, chloroplastic n=1 Tax=Quillaja saponaria TaxID=32244 RepID=A0AAD7L6E3_QUISA|nr:ATP-dependent Clp protease ATP-binding subunit CLPT2, chloroplastic [Quillaja saponaria]